MLPSLSPTQQKYSHLYREACAIIFGVKRFYQYIYGGPFTLVRSNKPVSQICGAKKGLPAMSAMRMQQYATFLQAF